MKGLNSSPQTPSQSDSSISWQAVKRTRLSSVPLTEQAKLQPSSTLLRTLCGLDGTGILRKLASLNGPTRNESDTLQIQNWSKITAPSIKRSSSGGRKDSGRLKSQARTTSQHLKLTDGLLTSLPTTKTLSSLKVGRWV